MLPPKHNTKKQFYSFAVFLYILIFNSQMPLVHISQSNLKTHTTILLFIQQLQEQNNYNCYCRTNLERNHCHLLWVWNLIRQKNANFLVFVLMSTLQFYFFYYGHHDG